MSKPGTANKTSEVSHRGDKVESNSKFHSPRMTEADEEQLAIWSREKESLETFAIFFAEKIKPFTSELLVQLKSDPESIHNLGH